VKFSERREYLYDQELFGRPDVRTALTIAAEYTRMHTPKNPMPTVLEVDRRSEKIDPLWHVSLDERTVFSRQFEIPSLVKSRQLNVNYTRVGLVPQQMCRFWFSNLDLQDKDWFPMRGDMVIFNGYRNLIVNVVLEPDQFWQQTNVWLSLACDTIIPAEGDARPVVNASTTVPRERYQTRPMPEV
jgi:hypothetical protein